MQVKVRNGMTFFTSHFSPIIEFWPHVAEPLLSLAPVFFAGVACCNAPMHFAYIVTKSLTYFSSH